MQTNSAQAQTKAQTLKTELGGIYAQILDATNKVPDRIRGGSYQSATKWKDVSRKWRSAAEKGLPAHNAIDKLEALVVGARTALEQIKTGSV